MSFWEKTFHVGKVVGQVVIGVGKFALDEFTKKSNEARSMSDNDLMRIANNSGEGTSMRRVAAFKELKDRGYTSEDIRS